MRLSTYINIENACVYAQVFFYSTHTCPLPRRFFSTFSDNFLHISSHAPSHTCPTAHSCHFSLFRASNFGACMSGHAKNVSQKKPRTKHGALLLNFFLGSPYPAVTKGADLCRNFPSVLCVPTSFSLYLKLLPCPSK